MTAEVREAQTDLRGRIGPTSKVEFHRAAPKSQRANANQAAATDLASVIALANEVRAAPAEKGLIKGSP